MIGIDLPMFSPPLYISFNVLDGSIEKFQAIIFCFSPIPPVEPGIPQSHLYLVGNMLVQTIGRRLLKAATDLSRRKLTLVNLERILSALVQLDLVILRFIFIQTDWITRMGYLYSDEAMMSTVLE